MGDVVSRQSTTMDVAQKLDHIVPQLSAWWVVGVDHAVCDDDIILLGALPLESAAVVVEAGFTEVADEVGLLEIRVSVYEIESFE